MIRIRRSEFVTCLGIFVASVSLFVLLRTQQYLAVDGATRCLVVYSRGRPIAGGNNHLLYFANVFVWMKTLSLAGVNPANAFDFIRLTHWMNALAAAGSLSMFWLLCQRATASIGIAWVATCAYAFSNAFLLHATSTAEPMMGLFWSFASISMVASGLESFSRLRLFAGGALLLLAMATYESMALIGPAELVLIYNWNAPRTSRNRNLALLFLAGCLVGGIITYATVYALSGTTAPLAMWSRFLAVSEASQVFGGAGVSKLLNLPIGFANSIVHSVPINYQGIRWLLRTHDRDRWILLTPAAVLLLVGWLAWTSRRLVSVWTELERMQRLILTCCAVALAFDIFPLIFWDPLYDKLWLQPLAVMFFASGVIFAAWRRLYPRILPRPLLYGGGGRPQRGQPGEGPAIQDGSAPGRRPFLLDSSAPLMFLPDALLTALIVTFGFAGAFTASRSSTPWLGAAGQLARTLRPSDLLVSNWDPVSLLYCSFWRDSAKPFGLPGIVAVNGPKALRMLDDEVSKVRNDGGRVFFIGVLDMPEADWKPFLENRCHLPYHSLDAMRRCAKPVETLSNSESEEVLWQLSLDCYKPYD